MNKINLGLLIFFCASFIYTNENKSQFDEVITVASKLPKENYKIPATVDSVSKKDLEIFQPSSVLGFLRNNLAIDSSSNGGPGQLASFFLRGSNSNQSIVKINGVKINPSTAGGASVYNLDTNLISKIEIGSGPFSSIHGSQAIGGIISISTKDKTLQDSVSIGFGAGPDNYHKEYLRGNLVKENASVNLIAVNSKTVGFPVLSNSNLNRGYDNHSIAGDISYGYKGLDISLSLWSSKGTTEYLVFGSPVSQDYTNEAFAADFKFTTKQDYYILVNINSSEDLINQNNENYLGVLDLTQTERQSYELLAHKKLKLFSYSIGLESESEDVNYSSYGTDFRKDLNTKAYFGTLEREQDRSSWIASARESDHDLYGKHSSWNLGFLHQLTRLWSLNLNAGSAFRSPNSAELYGFGSNQDLLPEVSKSREISLNQVKKKSALKFVVFTTSTSNLINFDYKDYVLKNIEEASNSGIEFRYRWINNLVDGSFILRKQNPQDQIHNQLLRRSKLSSSLNLNKNISGYEFSLNVSAFDRRKDFGGISLPGYALINIASKKNLT
jgi:vitamin B12 transporter